MSYRTLFTFDLVQETALHIGGSDADAFSNLATFARNGKGELTIRGASLAGAMFATAEKIYGQNTLPKQISVGFKRLPKRDQSSGGSETDHIEPGYPSLWRYFSTHPQENVETEIRQSVGIRSATGARAEGVLFDFEVSPKGTCWPVIVEVITENDEEPEFLPSATEAELDVFKGNELGDIAEKTAAAVLSEWSRGRCWLGANVARGLGWLNVENLRAARLDKDDVSAWPDNRKTPHEVLKELNPKWIEAKEFDTEFDLSVSSKQWKYISADCLISIGHSEDDDGYGIDTLSVGGQTTGQGLDELPDLFLRPQAMRKDAYFKENSAEEHIAVSRGPDGSVTPILPGSGIRGPLRHVFARYLNSKAGKSVVRDPNIERDPSDQRHNGENDADVGSNSQDPDNAEIIFGSLERSAGLLISDAALADGSQPIAAILHAHAEDEFTASVFETGKFTRTVLLSGSFACRLTLELRGDGADISDEDWNEFASVISKLGKSGHLPLGANKWRGAGWPRWTFSNWQTSHAGEDLKELNPLEAEA